MRKRVLGLSLAAALAAFALTGCAERVDFAHKDVAVDKTDVALVLQEGETEKLDMLPALESVDVSGSECYEEIMAWAAAHPDVAVKYTVSFPDGTVVDNTAETLTLGSISPDDAARAAELASFLPALKTVELGGTGLSPAGAYEFCKALDGVDIRYSTTLFGKTVDYATKSLDLRGMTPADLDEALLVLPYLPALKTVELGSDASCALGYGEVAALVAACPQVDFNFSFTLYGKDFTLLDKEMDLNHIRIDDGGALVKSVAECMKNLSYLDMDSCGVSNEDMAALRDALPNTKVVWRVWFGDNYTARTDVEKILASKPTAGGELRDRDAEVLKYCTDVKYLDIGHNERFGNLSFIQYMPKLEVAVLAMDAFTDLSPLSYCTELEYLELQTNDGISDISPLAGLTKLEHLNIARCKNISDITPLYNLTNLKRLWLGRTRLVPQEQIDELFVRLPDTDINTTVWEDPTSERWRVTSVDPWTNQYYYDERYELLCEQFGYLEGDYSLPGNDPLYKAH